MAFRRSPPPQPVPVASNRINCPNCSNIVPATNINIAALLAKCDLCGHLIRLADCDVQSQQPPVRPSGITEEPDPGSELSMKLGWFHPGHVPFLLFCIFWDGFLAFWCTLALFGGDRQAADDLWWILTFAIGFGAVGCAMTYAVASGFLNHTVISVARSRLNVRHGPLPWWGQRNLETSELVGIELDLAGNEPDQHLTVSVHHANGRQIALLFSTPERQARYIAHQLASHLKLPLRENFAERDRYRKLNVKSAFIPSSSNTGSPRQGDAATKSPDSASL